MEEKVLIDRKTLNALGVGTRLNILKLLIEKEYTLSEIAEQLNLEKPTIKEHLDTLADAGLIKREDTDRKWKYYALTRKGRSIIQPQEMRVMFVFALTLIAAIPLEMAFLRRLADAASPPLLTGTGQRGLLQGLGELARNNQELFILLVITQLALIIGAGLLGYLVRRRAIKI